jgi:GNAT superfamily N-acetyltransferase
MKTCYVIGHARAIADLVRPGELTSGWTITRINVPREHRGLGYGSVLLEVIITDADSEGVDLWLEISPSDGLDYNELHAWYCRHGFRTHFSSGYMVRRA